MLTFARQGDGGATVLRPTLAGRVDACIPMPRQYRFALHALRTPRMGPAPGGTTAALLPL
jgi:hypothetical protein